MATEIRSFIAFPISQELRQRTLDLVEELRQSDSIEGYADRLIDMVDEIAEVGMQYFFLHPVRMVGMNSLIQKTIAVTVQSGKKAVLGVSRQVARRLDDAQLREVAGFLESLFLDVEQEEEGE